MLRAGALGKAGLASSGGGWRSRPSVTFDGTVPPNVTLPADEALWLSFDVPYWKPHALRIGIGGVCAVSGEPFADGLVGEPQGYVVVPAQPWLDGINAGDGFVRQFVAVPLGEGLTVEA